jgi:hypothetical protein
LTPEEHSLVANSAALNGCSPGEYARQQLLASAKLPPETRFLAAELLAFQETFLALIAASLKGEPLSENHIAELRTRVAGIKSALVDQALEQFQSTTSRSL